MSKQTELEIQDTKRIIKHELGVLKSIAILKTRSEHRLAEYYEELKDLESHKLRNVYVVKIDRDSIRKNPDKDGSTTFAAGPWVYAGKGSYMRPVTPIHTLGGGPEYLCDLLPCDITCRFCQATFSYKVLVDDEDSDAICPKCGTYDCCVVEFERLEDVLEEINEEVL